MKPKETKQIHGDKNQKQDCGERGMDWKEAQGNFLGGGNVLYLLEQWLHGINKYQNSNRTPKTCVLYVNYNFKKKSLD